MTENSNLTVEGIVPAQTSVRLHEGWNLVGFPSFNSFHTAYNLKMEAGAERVERFDPAPQYWLSVLQDAYILLAGEVYWVRVEADIFWAVSVGW